MIKQNETKTFKHTVFKNNNNNNKANLKSTKCFFNIEKTSLECCGILKLTKKYKII